MKNYQLFVILLLACLLIPLNQAFASDWTGNVNFSLGSKALESDEWEPLEDQAEIGIDVDFREQNWPVSAVVALYGSYAEENIDGVDVEASTSELRFGARKIWEPTATMRPFVGGGLAIISAEAEATDVSYGTGISVTDSDTGAGVWLGGGIYWTLAKSFNLGVKLGYSQAEVSLFNEDVDAGGGHAGVMLGYHW